MKCPICNSQEKKKLRKICSNMKILGEMFDGEGTLVKCTACGCVYLDSKATQQDYLSYYTSDVCNPPDYYKMFGKEETNRYFEHILDELEQYLTPNCKILDIAGSWGELGSYIKGRHPEIQVTILDPKEECCEQVIKKGLMVIKDDSTHLSNYLENKYDIIILNHALEHFVNLKETMIAVRNLLAVDGIVFIEVPDAEEYCNQEVTPFSYLTYEHIVHLTQKDLHHLAQMAGYDAVKSEKYWKKCSKYPSICEIWKKGTGCVKEETVLVGRQDMCILQYIEESEKALETKLTELERTQEKLILWGIGASTALLLNSFSKTNVIQLVDSNKKRQQLQYQIGDKTLAIEDPSSIDCVDAVIFILSTPYRDAIEKQVRDMGYMNKCYSF